jgi:hypothetical protein
MLNGGGGRYVPIDLCVDTVFIDFYVPFDRMLDPMPECFFQECDACRVGSGSDACRCAIHSAEEKGV